MARDCITRNQPSLASPARARNPQRGVLVRFSHKFTKKKCAATQIEKHTSDHRRGSAYTIPPPFKMETTSEGLSAAPPMTRARWRLA